MSRHRRQRNKRWQRTLANANQELVEYGMRTYDHYGKISSVLPPLERLIVVERVKRELYDYNSRLRRIKIRQGRMPGQAPNSVAYNQVLHPAGHRYVPGGADTKKGNWRKATGPELQQIADTIRPSDVPAKGGKHGQRPTRTGRTQRGN